MQVEIADGIVAPVRQADERKRFISEFASLRLISLSACSAKESSERYVLDYGQCGKIAGSLLHRSDPHLTNAMGRVLGDVLTGEPDHAFGWCFETDDQIEQSALAGAVGADDGENLAIVDPHSHPIKGCEASIVLLDLIQLEKDHLVLRPRHVGLKRIGLH